MVRIKPIESGNVTGNNLIFNLILFAILFVVVISLFHVFVFSNKMLYGSDTIQAGVFFRSFYVDYMAQEGGVPVWNPYQFCGIPYVDGFHGDTYYPFSILKFFINIYRALGWNLILHVFLAGITMFGCARAFGRSQMASALAAVSYMFAAYFVSQVAPGHDGKMFVTSLFPLTIMLIELAFNNKPLLYFSLLGLVIGIIIITPHPQMAYYTLWACAFFVAFKLLDRYLNTKSLGVLVKPISLFTMAVIIGLAISAIHFYPGYDYVKNYSPRADEKRGENWAKSWSLHWEETVSLVVPEFCGVSGEQGNTYWGRNPFKDNSEYAGAVPLMMALVAIIMVRSRRTWFFGGLALFALIYGLSANTPFFHLFYYLIPNVKSTRAWSMIMFLFSFSTALLASFGLDFVIERSRAVVVTAKKRATIGEGKKSKKERKKELKKKGRKSDKTRKQEETGPQVTSEEKTEKKADRNVPEQERMKYILALFGLPVLVFLGAIFFLVLRDNAVDVYKAICYSQNPMRPTPDHLNTIIGGFWITCLFLFAAAVSVWLYSRKKVGVIFLWIIVALALVDAFRFDLGFIRTFNQTRTFTANPIVDFFKSAKGKFRVLELSGLLPTNYLPFHRIEEMTSYHGNQPRWYQNLLGGIGAPNKLNPNLLNITNTRYLLTSPASPIRSEQFEAAGYIKGYRWKDFQVFENRNVNSRAHIVHEWIVEPDEKKLQEAVLLPSFNTAKQVALAEAPNIEPVTDSALTVKDLVIIETYKNDFISINTISKTDGILVLADNWYPAWKAFLDGEEVDVFKANGAFRGIILPAGEHTVEYRYISSTHKIGRWLTIAGLLFVGLVVVGNAVSRRKKGKTETVE